MGSNYDCPVCLETVTPLCNKILLVSSQCGHFICDKCADTQCKSTIPLTNAKNPLSNVVMNVGTNQCAICRTNVTRKSYTPYSVDNALYNSYYEVRRKINQIFNSTRANFANTPLYDAYLEQREDLIYELAECETDAKRSKIEQQIRNYQRENARLIEENNTLQKIQHKKQVIDIVKTEDIFYEIVANRCLFKNEPPSLIHPLQRTYSDYFIIDQVKLSAEVEPQPLNGNIKQDTDIVRARYGTLKQLIESDVAGGFNQKLLEFTCREKFESLVFITQPQ